MKLKLSIVVLILFSFLNIGAVSNPKINNDFNKLELSSRNISEFCENGVKLQYKTKNDLKDEKNKIFNYFIGCNFNKGENIAECNLEFSKISTDVLCNLWEDSNYTYVDITVTNKNKEEKISSLTTILDKLVNAQCRDVQYFYYYKGKTEDDYINKSTSIIDEIIKELNLNKVDILEINNGYTATSYTKNGEKINFAISKYDTGSYIIVGSPIIFITY